MPVITAAAKTNVAVNCAKYLRSLLDKESRVTLADHGCGESVLTARRTAHEELAAAGIHADIAPSFANTNVDLPGAADQEMYADR